jgi:hypothetical protein
MAFGGKNVLCGFNSTTGPSTERAVEGAPKGFEADEIGWLHIRRLRPGLENADVELKQSNTLSECKTIDIHPELL